MAQIKSTLSLDCLPRLVLEILLEAEVAVSKSDSSNPDVEGDCMSATPSALREFEVGKFSEYRS